MQVDNRARVKLLTPSDKLITTRSRVRNQILHIGWTFLREKDLLLFSSQIALTYQEAAAAAVDLCRQLTVHYIHNCGNSNTRANVCLQ